MENLTEEEREIAQRFYCEVYSLSLSNNLTSEKARYLANQAINDFKKDLELLEIKQII